MTDPKNKVPFDDSDESETDDQQSQRDIHSNGFDDGSEIDDNYNGSDADRLEQASDASEAAYLLNLDDNDDE